MSLSTLYPSTRPSLLLDFAGSETIDPRITFTRASTARFYDQNTVAKAEENLLLYSASLTNSWWLNSDLVVTSGQVGPDGTATAIKIAANTVSSQHLFGKISLGATGQALSVFVKPAGSTTVELNPNSASVFARFSLVGAGTVTASANGTASIQALSDGWYRLSFVLNAPAGAWVLWPDGTTGSYVGDGTTGVLVWGPQFEARAAVTAYTATTTAPITRYQPQLMTAAANIARLDHDPITREARGLLIEESRSNLLTFSEDFGNAAWTKTGAGITANAVVAPDGTLTADRLVEDTSTGDHRAFQSGSFTAGVTYTVSVYAKQSGRSLLQIYHNAGGGLSVTFNLSNGTVSAATVGTGTVADVGNGWYRCSATALVDATGSANVQLRMVNTGINTSYTGDGYSGIFIWGAQLEAGAFATSYIARLDATAASRATDVASMTGTNFTSWFSAGEGALYAEFNTGVTSATIDTPGTARGVAAITDNTPNNRLRFAISTFLVRAGGATVAEIYGPVVAAGTTYKTAAVYALNDYALSVNGALSGTDTSGVLPTGLSRLDIGASTEAGGILNGYVRKLAFYPKRLANSQLQSLTR